MSHTPHAFAYHRAVAPMMWVFVGLASTELVVVHLLVAMWRPWIAAVLSLLSVASIAWLVGVIRSFRRLPVLIGDETLVMRVGTLRRVDVPLTQVRLVDGWDAATLKGPGVAKLSLIAWPNLVVNVEPPVRSRRSAVRLVAHRLDDPVAFRAALAARASADRGRCEVDAVA